MEKYDYHQDISVIIPVYNTEMSLFNRAINSIKFNCEIVVVNDGSDLEYNYVCPGAKMIRLTKNVGHLHARRIGVENATGKWVLFLDSDDQLYSDAIDTINEVFTDTSINSNCVKLINFNYGDANKQLFNVNGDNFVTNKLWDREFLLKVMESFVDYPNVTLGEDHLILLKANDLQVTYYNSDKVIYFKHEPHTCNKIPADSSKEEVKKVWNDMKVFRESLYRLKSELKHNVLSDYYFSELSFRLSTCKLSLINPDVISEVTGVRVIRKPKIDFHTIRACNNILSKYFEDADNLCKHCCYYEDTHLCRYDNDMVTSCEMKQCSYFYSAVCNKYDKDYEKQVTSITEYLAENNIE